MDAQVAPFAHRIGLAALERLVDEAVARFMPDRAAEDALKAAEGRHFTVEHQQVSFNGTSQITGELDLADALDLDAAVAQGAEALRALGSTESLDVRRSLAAGQLARNQLALDLTTTTGWSSKERSERTDETTTPNRRPKPRQVVLYVHLSDAAITGTRDCLELARVENQRQVVTADQIRTWCANPDAQVVVKPVIDLNEHIHVEGYEVPARLREQTMLRDHSCVFPWCTRTARRADADHVIPYAEGGTTSSDNIAPLCRRHHRLKTHSSWGYTMLEPGSFCGPARTATSSCATTTAPSMCPATDAAQRTIRRIASLAAPGLVCPLASLAARPPVVLADRGVRMWFRDARFARSPNHRRLARSSTTGGARFRAQDATPQRNRPLGSGHRGAWRRPRCCSCSRCLSSRCT